MFDFKSFKCGWRGGKNRGFVEIAPRWAINTRAVLTSSTTGGLESALRVLRHISLVDSILHSRVNYTKVKRDKRCTWEKSVTPCRITRP
jgi:hypothetical protein